MSDNDKYLVLADSTGIRFSVYRKPNQAAEYFLKPAEELLYYLRLSLGGDIPEQDDALPVKLLLHMDYCGGLEREEFEITCGETDLVLRAGTLEAMFHAVYYFLEKALGIRWLWPGKSGEVVPRREQVTFAQGTIREKPDFAWRAIQTGGSFYEAMDYNTALRSIMHVSAEVREQFDVWCRRNRFGGLRVADGHRWSEIAPAEDYGEIRPELYALVDGKRDCVPFDGKHRNQPCLTYSGTIQRMQEYTMGRLASEPHLDVFSIALNDGGESCECENCEEFDRQADSVDVQAAAHFDTVTSENAASSEGRRSVTDRVIWNANQVAESLKARFPERMLLILLYSHFRRPPVTHRLDGHVIGQFCIMGNMFWNEEIKRSELELLRNMGKFVERLGIYEYYANGAWPEIHRLFPDLVEMSVREYYGAGARYFATQPSDGFAVNGLNFYVLGRMLWNVDAQAADIVDDFCRSGFGPAAETIRLYLKGFADRWRNVRSGTDLDEAPERRLAYSQLYDMEFLQDRQRELDHAKEEAEEDERILERIRFLESGLGYTRAYSRALQATLRLYRDCHAANLEELKEAPMEPDQLASVLQAWDDYWDFIKKYQGQFVFGDFWVHYRPGPWGSKDATLSFLRQRGSQAK